MKLFSFMAAFLLALGLFVHATPAAYAYSEGESRIMGMVQGLSGNLDALRYTTDQISWAVTGRFDNLDSKLDRIYAVCNRTATPASARTTVNLAQATTCINRCFASSPLGYGSAGSLNSRTFSACVSRCPSNTLRNIECSYRYLAMTTFTETVTGNGYTSAEAVGHSPEGMANVCARNLITSQEICRQWGDVLVTSLASCLIDQRAFACQADCDASFRDTNAYFQCVNRCNASARSSAAYQQLRESGFINQSGRLNVPPPESMTTTNALNGVAPLTPTPAAFSTPTSVVNPSTGETYVQCVYRCDSERLACLRAATKGDDMLTCESGYTSCYATCNSKRTP